MKARIIFTLVVLPIVGYCQDAGRKDTVVAMNEVVVRGVLSDQTRQIKDFYVANKAATTEDILARMPEVTMVRRGSYGSEPLLRTYNSGQVSVLIDGMRIHGACTDKMDPVTVYVEPQNLKGINIQTSGAAQGGSNVGGIVDLTLREPECGCERPVSGALNSGYQSAAGYFYESGQLSFSKERWAIRTNATYRKAGNYRSGGGAVVANSRYEKMNAGLSAVYKLNSSWNMKADFLYDDGYFIGYPALPMDVGYAAARIASLSVMKWKPESRWERMQYKVYGNTVYHLMDDTHRPNIAMHMDMPGRSSTVGTYGEATLRLGARRHLMLRGDVSATDLYASMTMYQAGQPDMYMLTWPDNRTIQSGLAATYTVRPDTQSSVVVATRVDQFTSFLTTQDARDQLTVLQEHPEKAVNRLLKNFSVAYSRDLSGQVKAVATAAYAERMPTQSELYGFYLFNAFDNYDYIGRTDLKTENAYKGDVSLSYSTSDVLVSVTAFASRVNNYIMGVYEPTWGAMTIGALGVKRYANMGYGNMAGAEAAFVWKAPHGTQVVSTFRYNYGADDKGAPLPLINPLRNISSVRKKTGRWTTQLDAEMALRQDRVNVAAREVNTPDFFTANVRVAYATMYRLTAFTIEGGCENLFDAHYREHTDWGRVYRPGRNIYVQVNCSF
jgi:iron complex outermembrane recepter protein